MTWSSRSAYSQLLQRRLEGVHQMMGQLGNKPDGVGQQHVQVVRHRRSCRVVVSRVSNSRLLAGMPAPVSGVEQRGFSRVRVAHNGHHRDGIFHPPLPLDGAHLAHLRPAPASSRLMRSRMCRRSDLQLRLAGAAGADAAALPGQARAHAGRAGAADTCTAPAPPAAGPPAVLARWAKMSRIRALRSSTGRADDLLQRPDVAREKARCQK